MPARYRRPLLLAVPLAMATACGDPAVIDTLIPERGFTVTTVAMEPALPLDSTVQAVLAEPARLQRGDIVLVRGQGGDTYVSRLIGLPGDTVALREGVVILNGAPAGQVPRGTHTLAARGDIPAQTVRRLRETLPGTAQGHDILDLKAMPGDDYGPVTLGPDAWFVLGDNRDFAADSRYQPMENGLGLVTAAQITRRVAPGSVAP